MTKQLVVEHVSKVFGGLKAVADVSLTIDQGSLIALIGPNRSEERRVGKECRL